MLSVCLIFHEKSRPSGRYVCNINARYAYEKNKAKKHVVTVACAVVAILLAMKVLLHAFFISRAK